MRPPALSQRLSLIADRASPCQRLVDVGCDRGLLAIHMLLSGKAERAVLTDIHSGPCAEADKALMRYGLHDRATLYCCDGIGDLELQAGDSLVIAGMGGHEIASILRNVQFPDGLRMVLQPMWNREVLRRFLAMTGWILEEEIIQEKGRFYTIFLPFKGGTSRELTLPEASLGTRFSDENLDIHSLRPVEKLWIQKLYELYEKKSRKYPEYQEVCLALKNLCGTFQASI